METRKVNLPKKGAGRRMATKLKNLGKQNPPKDIVKKINGEDEKQKIAAASRPVVRDLDL